MTTYDISFDICAILVLIIMIYSFMTRYNVPLKENSCFRSLLFLVLVTCVTDLLSALWANHTEIVIQYFPTWVNIMINMCYFASRTLTCYFYLRYILYTLDIHWQPVRHFVVERLPLYITLFFTLTTPFTKAIFYVDQYGVYHRGEIISLIYAFSIYYIIAGAIMVLFYHKVIPWLHCVALMSFIIISAITVAIQDVRPYTPVEGFGAALCLLILFFSVQKPEEILDGSTGLLNKKLFVRMCSIKLQQKSSFVVLTFWIDHYNIFEKNYGIHVMDKLFRALCADLKSAMKDDRFYRVSENTISIILDTKSKIPVEQKAESAMKALSHTRNIEGFQIKLPVYYSRFHVPEDSETVEDLFNLIEVAATSITADNQLVSVKKLDIHRYKERYKLEALTKMAARNTDMLRIVYQPIFCVDNCRFAGAEALVRMTAPDGTPISPQQFIPVAEENGTILEIDCFVQDSVCRFMAKNQLRNLGLNYIEVNLSTVECMQENLHDSILSHLHRYNLDPSCLNLEITETAASNLPEDLNSKIAGLAAAGVSFSLDDYGTGYSNISRLMQLPFDIVKIDKTLIKDVFTSSSSRIILENTIRMLKQLNKKILVEGVETEIEANYILGLGCDYIQGYFYSKPMEADEFIQFLQIHNTSTASLQ